MFVDSVDSLNSRFILRHPVDTDIDIQCESKNYPPPYDFRQFLLNGWKFLIEILHTYYAFKYTISCQILSNILQLLQSYAALSATTPRILSFQNTFIASFTNW